MKLKKFTSVLAVSSALVLNACGGGGAAGPTQNAGYGDVVSISQQNLGVYASMKVLYPVMLQTGNFGIIKGTSFSVESAFESANIINSATTFNFNPVAPVTTNPGYFKAASVSAFAVEYKTPGQNATTNTSQISRTGSGLIIVPNGVAPRGVVVYFHPTTWGKNQVPSCLGPLASGNISSSILFSLGSLNFLIGSIAFIPKFYDSYLSIQYVGGLCFVVGSIMFFSTDAIVLYLLVKNKFPYSERIVMLFATLCFIIGSLFFVPAML